MNYSLKNGIYYLSGRLDESADFSPIAAASPDPIRLDFEHVDFVNSIGIRNLLRFLMSAGDVGVEYTGLPPSFVSNVNVIPQLLGNRLDPFAVKTFFLPYCCESCRTNFSHLLRMRDVSADGKTLKVPDLECPKCKSVAEVDADIHEYLGFVVDDDGTEQAS